jgi:hypothetical protein
VTDLAAQVLVWLDTHEETSYVGGESTVCDDPDGGLLRYSRAIRAVLTAHTPWVSPPGVGHCARCGQPAPCHTVRAVASGLGVLEDEEG